MASVISKKTNQERRLTDNKNAARQVSYSNAARQASYSMSGSTTNAMVHAIRSPASAANRSDVNRRETFYTADEGLDEDEFADADDGLYAPQPADEENEE